MSAKKNEQIIITILFISLTLLACGEKTEVITSIENDIDWPNETTQNEYFKTTTIADNEVLFSHFKEALEADKFEITDIKQGEKYSGSYYNCGTNTTISFKGDGIRYYIIKRTEAKPAHYYPDFTLTVYGFATEDESQAAFKLVDAALNSAGKYCNGKAPMIAVKNKKEIFELSTRAEMFRGYIEDFAQMLESY